MFTVEKGIPIPASVRRGKTEKYGFSNLKENGDSFFIPADESADQLKKVQHAAYSAEKRLSTEESEIRFVVRPFEQDGNPGVRVWRKDNK